MFIIMVFLMAIVIGVVSVFSNFPELFEGKKPRENKTLNLINEANRLFENKENFLSACKDEKEKRRLEIAFDEMFHAYIVVRQEALYAVAYGTCMKGKKPINPYIAAGIGNGLAGFGGAVAMGTAAHIENEKYNESERKFQQQIIKCQVSEKDLEKSIDKIKSMIGEK